MTSINNQNGNDDAVRALGLEDQSTSMWKKPKLWLVGIILALACGGALSYFSASAETLVQYNTSEVVRGSLSVKVIATGALEPINQVVVGSELSGTIAHVDVDFNATVERDQILARLDTDQIEIRVTQARATLNVAEAKLQEEQANFTEAKNEFDRCKTLSSGNLCPQQKSDAAKAAYLRAQARRAAAKAQVEHAKATLMAGEMDIKKAMVRSPIKGIILSRAIEPGQTVASSFQTPDLFTIADDLRNMELHVDVDEADVGRVREGQLASFTVDAYPKLKFPAEIKQLRYAAQRVEGVVTYKALLSVDNPDLLLRPGMTATAEIFTKQVEDAILIPNAALRFQPSVPSKNTKSKPRGGMLAASMPWHPRSRGPKKTKRPVTDAQGKSKVWVLQQGKPVSVPITVGATDGRMTEVLSGDLSTEVVVVTEMMGGR